MQCESPNGDNESCHSDESNLSIGSMNKERLEALINMELKHSGVYYDLHSKDNLLKVDLENVYNSCQRFEKQERKKSEVLEESYEKLTNYQKSRKIQLQEQLSAILLKLEETNSSFCGAFNDYKSEVLKSSIHYLDSDTEQVEKNIKENTEHLHFLRVNGKIDESLMKSKCNQISNIEKVTNTLFESSMKRPEIELAETVSKLTDEMKKLEQKRQELKSMLRKNNK